MSWAERLLMSARGRQLEGLEQGLETKACASSALSVRYRPVLVKLSSYSMEGHGRTRLLHQETTFSVFAALGTRNFCCEILLSDNFPALAEYTLGVIDGGYSRRSQH